MADKSTSIYQAMEKKDTNADLRVILTSENEWEGLIGYSWKIYEPKIFEIPREKRSILMLLRTKKWKYSISGKIPAIEV